MCKITNYLQFCKLFFIKIAQIPFFLCNFAAKKTLRLTKRVTWTPVATDNIRMIMLNVNNLKHKANLCLANMTKEARMLLAAASVVLVALVAVGGYSAYVLLGAYTDNDEHIVYIYKGERPEVVRQKLEVSTHSTRLAVFRYLLDMEDYYDNIQPGRYDIGHGISTVVLARRLCTGRETPVNLTVPPMHNVKELSEFLGRKLMGKSSDYLAALRDTALLGKYGLTRETALCIFLRNTYEVYWTVDGPKLIERMAKEYDRYWTKKRRTKLKRIDDGFTREQAVTLASIVECETANNDEKPRIAGLYINRLHQGIKLQADPTVKYAVGDFGIRRILLRHLQTDSPYNTYRVKGLPPGPICIPSQESLEAVLNYERHNYIYMCAKEDFSGTHNFAATDKEHAENARRFQQALDQRGITH